MEVMTGFKRTELGSLPDQWDVVEIGDSNPFVTSGSRGWAGYYSEFGAPFIRITNMSRKVIRLDLGDLKLVKLPLGLSEGKRTRLQSGDVLISITADIGIVSFVGSEVPFPAYINQHIALVRFDPTKVDGQFASYFLAAETSQKWFRGLTDTGAKAGMSLPTIRKIRLACPQPSEQRAIAAALTDMDALISGLDRLIVKKCNLKQAAKQQLLTGQRRLPGFKGEWEAQTIEQFERIGIIKLGRGKVISKKDIEQAPGENPIYSSSVQRNGLFGSYQKFMFDEELITWSVDGGGHFFYRTKHKFSVTNVCGFMHVDTKKFSYPFLAAQLQSLHSRLKFDYQDKAHPSVIRKAYLLFCPPLLEQLAIAKVLSDMDEEITVWESLRDKTRDLKQGMIQELLTGRIRLV